MRIIAPLVLSLLLLTACGEGEMSDQPKYKAYGAAVLFRDGKVNQAPPDGTVARGDLDRAAVLANRPPMSLALLERGQERFDIFCSVCHGRVGDGNGIIPQHGFPHPPSYHIPRLRNAPDDYFLRVISQGYGAMYSYADRIPPADRWAIVAYIRALQLSQDVPVAQLPPDVRRTLESGR
jgi:mono/diheme cytochrome c family protein